MDNLSVRDQAMRNSIAAKQAAILPSGCKACMREGLAIFPLRVAAITSGTSPSWHPPVPDQKIELTGGEYKYALRTLREGYVYVLLDGSIWQAYQVTEQGHMREFYYKDHPEGEKVEPLSHACREANHDITASFLNIPTSYSLAEIAFSSDPWSPQVLEQYAGNRPEGRFIRVDLEKFKAAPESHDRGLKLDFSLSSLTERVTEFHTEFLPQPGIAISPYGKTVTGGIHGFYPRTHIDKMKAMRGAVAGVIDKYGSAGAIILDDTVGVIQELNGGRLQLIKDCHDYTSRTEVRHQYMTSQAITQTLKSVQDAIAKNSQPEYGRPDSGYPMAMHQVTSAEEVAKRTSAFQLAQLNACYSEPARQKFEALYNSCVEDWQKVIAAVDSDLAACYLGKDWLTVMEHDYAPQKNSTDWLLHMKTLTACLQGGPMTHSDEVWTGWMKKPDSPAYVGLLAMNHTMNAAVFNQSAGLNDLQSVTTPPAGAMDGPTAYSYVKTAGGSDEFASFLKLDAVQTLVTGRVLALNAAMSRLKDKVDEATRNGYSRMLQGSAYSLTGETIHVLEVDMTIRRFQRLVELYPNSWLQPTVASPFGGAASGGAAAATGGLSTITDEKILNQPVTIRIASTDPGAQAALGALPKGASIPEKISAVSGLRVSSVALKGDTGVPTATPESLLTERNRRFLSGNSVGLILSSLMLGLQIASWQQNTDNMEQAVKDHTDTSMKLAINRLMVLSATAEIGGFSHMMITRLSWKALDDAGFVHPLIKAGGVLAGVAAVIDGFRMLFVAYDSMKSGDYASSVLYLIAAANTGLGGALGVVSSWNGVFALAGMAGLGALLILVGAGIAYAANQYRSTPIQIWLRCSCFGTDRHKHDVVWYAENPKDLSTMMGAWYAVMSGMVAEVAFSAPTIIYGEYYREIEMKLVLPGYKDGVSALQYSLAGDSTSLVSQTANDITVNPRCVNPERKQIVIDDAVVLLVRICVKETMCSAATLTASFWPDATVQEHREGLTVKAEV